MVGQKTLDLFYTEFAHTELICVGLLQKRLKISRVTASNLISALLNRNSNKHIYKVKIQPCFMPSDSRKWYKVIKPKTNKKTS